MENGTLVTDKRTPAPQAHGFNHGLGAVNK